MSKLSEDAKLDLAVKVEAWLSEQVALAGGDTEDFVEIALAIADQDEEPAASGGVG